MERDISPVVLPTSISMECAEGIVELDRRSIRDLADIAIRNGTGYGTAIVQVVANEKFLDDLQADGYQLILEQPDGRMRRLVRGAA